MSDLNINDVIESLEELSDMDLQLKLWRSPGGQVSSYVEAVEQLFTDSGLSLLLHKNKTGLGSNCEKLLTELEGKLSSVKRTESAEALISSREMEAVRSKATEALTAIKLRLKS